MDYAPFRVSPQGPPSPHGQTQGILTFDNFSCQSPHPHFYFCIRIPSIPHHQGWGSIILNVRIGPRDEYHCHNPLGGCQKTVRVPWVAHEGWLGNHTDWCISFFVAHSASITTRMVKQCAHPLTCASSY